MAPQEGLVSSTAFPISMAPTRTCVLKRMGSCSEFPTRTCVLTRISWASDLPHKKDLCPPRFSHKGISGPRRRTCALQEFPTRFSRKIFPQKGFVPCKKGYQWPHKFFCKDLCPARISHKNISGPHRFSNKTCVLQNWILIGWLPHQGLVYSNAKFKTNRTALLNMPFLS